MGIKVIIADADMAVREMLARVVIAEGYEVSGEAATVHETLRHCENVTFGILILEANLTGLPGWEVLRRLQERRERLKVLAFCNTDNPVRIRQMLREHPDGFVGKSDPLSSLLEGLRMLSSGHIYFSAAIVPHWKTMGGSTPEKLTARETEIIQLVARSLSSKEIAARLGLALKTVENHRARLMEKLRTRNSAGLTSYAIQYGLVSFE